MKQKLLGLIDQAKKLGVSYSDIRFIRDEYERIAVKNDQIDEVSGGESEGIGIRVLIDGAWGFYATNQMDEEGMNQCLEKAYKIAKNGGKISEINVEIEEIPPQNGTYSTAFEIDPFTVSKEKKIQLLLECTKIMMTVEGVKISKGSLISVKEHRCFASTDGTYVVQNIIKTGGGIQAMAIRGDDVQMRSYPAAFDGDFSASGWEFIENIDLIANSLKTAQEAVALLEAEECPHDVMDLILGSSHLALQIHESLGHPAELDRVLGHEISLAGGSFLTTDKVDNFKYGSEHVTINSDPTLYGGMGSYGWDDEGVPAKRAKLVDKGLFVNYLSSRESAPLINKKSTGAMRVTTFNRPPIIRMTNVNLEPGNWTLEDLIKDTKKGIYMETTKSWSIDELRLNFQFGCQIGWLIEDGCITKMIKNPLYSGTTPEFWNNCDAIVNKDRWRLWGIMNCGKGEPMQSAHVGHGCSLARFKNVQIGVEK